MTKFSINIRKCQLRWTHATHAECISVCVWAEEDSVFPAHRPLRALFDWGRCDQKILRWIKPRPIRHSSGALPAEEEERLKSSGGALRVFLVHVLWLLGNAVLRRLRGRRH